MTLGQAQYWADVKAGAAEAGLYEPAFEIGSIR